MEFHAFYSTTFLGGDNPPQSCVSFTNLKVWVWPITMHLFGGEDLSPLPSASRNSFSAALLFFSRRFSRALICGENLETKIAAVYHLLSGQSSCGKLQIWYWKLVLQNFWCPKSLTNLDRYLPRRLACHQKHKACQSSTNLGWNSEMSVVNKKKTCEKQSHRPSKIGKLFHLMFDFILKAHSFT